MCCVSEFSLPFLPVNKFFFYDNLSLIISLFLKILLQQNGLHIVQFCLYSHSYLKNWTTTKQWSYLIIPTSELLIQFYQLYQSTSLKMYSQDAYLIVLCERLSMKVLHKWESVLVTHRLGKNSNCDTTVHFHMSKLYFILEPLTTKKIFFSIIEISLFNWSSQWKNYCNWIKPHNSTSS